MKKIKTKQDYYNRRQYLQSIIARGRQASAELSALEHRYGWAVFSCSGTRTGLDALEDELEI